MSHRRGEAFAGCTVALVTPFRGGEIDFDALGRLVDWHLAQGTPVISPVGTTGESPTMTHDEHERVIAFVVERVAGRAKVMAGTGSNATSEAVRLTRFARSAGADAALVVAPYYNRPSQEGIYRHYAAIADACDLPQVLYNVPGRTGRNVEPATVERIARQAPVVAVKEASGAVDQASDVLLRTDLTVLSGDDSLTLPILAIGGSGVVSVAANLVPGDVQALVTHFRAGRLAEAQALHARLFALCRDLMGLAPNPIPVKTALALLGRGNGEMRLPLCELEAPAVEALRGSLARYGLRA
jgi:4-hydroxy-tetrahydrodipicolinate synthase